MEVRIDCLARKTFWAVASSSSLDHQASAVLLLHLDWLTFQLLLLLLLPPLQKSLLEEAPFLETTTVVLLAVAFLQIQVLLAPAGDDGVVLCRLLLLPSSHLLLCDLLRPSLDCPSFLVAVACDVAAETSWEGTLGASGRPWASSGALAASTSSLVAAAVVLPSEAS